MPHVQQQHNMVSNQLSAANMMDIPATVGVVALTERPMELADCWLLRVPSAQNGALLWDTRRGAAVLRKNHLCQLM